ncbi:hypothetical protein BDZ91DRAFT_717333 [Kalaharituber pfeilii]|nr:hypothetical protein BDZ91DRAFT_717333 [Kalaharituber pfeilii]
MSKQPRSRTQDAPTSAPRPTATDVVIRDEPLYVALIRGGLSVTAALRECLNKCSTPIEKAKLLRDTQIHLGEEREISGEVITRVQEIIESDEIWEDLGVTKEELFEQINYISVIRPAITEYARTDGRKERALTEIGNLWGPDWINELDPEGTVMPSVFSEHFLRYMRRIARISNSVETIGDRIKREIRKRKEKRGIGTRATHFATVRDLMAVAARLSSQIVEGNSRPRAETSKRVRMLSPKTEDPQNEERTAKRTQLDTVPGDDDEPKSEGDTSDDNISNDADADVDTASALRNCQCPPAINEGVKRRILVRRAMKADVSVTIRDLEYFSKNRALDMLCWYHHRELCAGIGLKVKSGSRNELTRRLHYVYENRFALGDLTVARSSWFKKDYRGRVPEDDLGPMKYVPRGKGNEWSFNAEKVFIRYAGANAWDEWLSNGTTIARGTMAWMLVGDEAKTRIKQEIYMYTHHRRRVNGSPNYGWLRNSYHSLIQQIARLDPVYYALVVAARPDGNYRQISFPYYMKAALPGDYTFFQHLDLNMRRYIECRQGMNRIQTSLTLNQESPTNCTMVLPGFHRHIVEWWGKVKSRGHDINPPSAGKSGKAEFGNIKRNQEHDGNMHRTDRIYLPEDKEAYGELVPAICGPGDIRISKPEILHGSSSNSQGRAESKRWVVNPWFVGIQEDHSTLDIPESATWEVLSNAHRDLLALSTTPSGQNNVHGFPRGRFAGSIALRGLSALSDALVGARRWTDPDVLEERNLVLGEDDAAAWEYINKVRGKLMAAWEEGFEKIKRWEQAAYGETSYFRKLELEGEVEPTSEDAPREDIDEDDEMEG